MYTVAIIEDDPRQSELLIGMIEQSEHGDSFTIQCLSSVEELDAWLPNGDILFSDINLGDGFNGQDGIQMVKSHLVDAKAQVIYVTGYLEYCTPVYETNHVYLLAKPVQQEHLQAALDRAVANIEQLRSAALVLTVGGRAVSLLPSEIHYIESDRRKVRVHAGDRSVDAYSSLSSLADKLPASFVSCHKSFLVNMDYIAEVAKDGIVLRSGEMIPVSRQKRSSVKHALMEYLGSI